MAIHRVTLGRTICCHVLPSPEPDRKIFNVASTQLPGDVGKDAALINRVNPGTLMPGDQLGRMLCESLRFNNIDKRKEETPRMLESLRLKTLA